MRFRYYAFALLLLCSCTAKQSDKIICETERPVKIIEQDEGAIRVELLHPEQPPETIKFSTTQTEIKEEGFISRFIEKTTGLVAWIALIVVSL